MLRGINILVFIYLLILVIDVSAYAEELQCYVCIDCDVVNETHIAACEKPDDSETESPVTEKPSTDALYTDTPKTEKPNTMSPSTEPPVTDGTTISTSNTEAPTTNEPKTDLPSTDTPVTNDPNTEVPSTDTSVTYGHNSDMPSTDTPVTNELNNDVINIDTSVTDRLNTEVSVTEAPESDRQNTGANTVFPAPDRTNTDAPSVSVPEIQIVNDARTENSPLSRSNLVNTLREIHSFESGIRCVLTSFIDNDRIRIVRGCSFEFGDAEDRCRGLIGEGFTGNLTQCTICERNLCNSASKIGTVLITIFITTYLNAY